MHTLLFYLRIYFKLAFQYLKERMQFRSDFICEIIGMLFINLFGLLGFWVVFQSITQLNNWSFYEMVFLYGFSLIAMSPQQLLLDNGWTLSNRIVSGDFIKYCFRPMNILFYYMSETVDVKGFSQLILGIVILVISWVKLHIAFSFVKLLLLLVFLLGAIFVCMGLIILSSTCGFMGGGTNAAMMLASELKGYGQYPLSIFKKGLRFIFSFVIPIGFLFFIISCKIWIYFALRYAGTGS